MTISITVLMSVYNDKKYIKESILSVLNQTYKNFEFIIINDGSTDSSLEIINQFALSDSRIRVINKSNSGLYRSLNLGIQKARGEWISIIDSDDVYEPNKLESQYLFSKFNKSINLIGSHFTTINANGKKTKDYKVPTNEIQLKNNLSKKKLLFPHSSFFYKKELARKIKYRPEIFEVGSDYDFSLRFSEIGDLACMDLFLVRIRKHGQQISFSKSYTQLINSRVAQISHLLRKSGHDDPTDIKDSDKLFLKFLNFIKQDSKLRKLNNFQLFISQINYLLFDFNIKNFIKLILLVLKSPLIILNYIFFHFSDSQIENELIDKWIEEYNKVKK